MRAEFSADDDMLKRPHDGRYFWARTGDMWAAYQAAALTTPPASALAVDSADAFYRAVPTLTRDQVAHPNDTGQPDWCALADEATLKKCLALAFAQAVAPAQVEQKPVYQVKGNKGGWVDVSREVYDNAADWNRRILYTRPQAAQPAAQITQNGLLFCDLKTDEEKYNFFLSGQAYASGIIAKSIQNDVAMAYKRCAGYQAACAAGLTDAEIDVIAAPLSPRMPSKPALREFARAILAAQSAPANTKGCAGFQGKPVGDCGVCGGVGCDAAQDDGGAV